MKKLSFLNEEVVSNFTTINYDELVNIINSCKLKSVEDMYNSDSDSDSDFKNDPRFD